MTTTHDHTTRCWWNSDEAAWVCVARDASSTAPIALDRELEDQPPLVDVRDMIVVHTAMLREFRLAPAAVCRVEPGDTRAAQVVDRHLGFLCDMLHHHHAGEDELLWPLLRTRAPAAAARLVDEVESQHAGIDSALGQVALARSAWADRADPLTRDVLVAALEQLHGLFKAHLEHEESSLLPLAASVLASDEWNAVGEAASAAMSKPALLLAVGMFAYEGDPAVLRSMLASAPAVVRALVLRLSPRVYARRARQVHGLARP